MRFYRRRLPHLDAPGMPVFVTWRLAGSLPQERKFPNETLPTSEAFVAYDRLLDEARSGPMYLHRPKSRESFATGWSGRHVRSIPTW